MNDQLVNETQQEQKEYCCMYKGKKVCVLAKNEEQAQNKTYTDFELPRKLRRMISVYKLPFIFLLAFLCSCGVDDTIEPEPKCEHEVAYVDGRAVIHIVSDAPQAEVCYVDQFGVSQCLTIVEHYYGCIVMEMPVSTTLTIETGVVCKYYFQ